VTSTPSDVWPVETELLESLGRTGWTVHVFGPRQQPVALAAVKPRLNATDVVIIRGHDRVAAFRTLETSRPLQAEHVVWHCLGAVVTTFKALMTLADSADYGNPYPIPAECRVPELDIRPYTIRPLR